MRVQCETKITIIDEDELENGRTFENTMIYNTDTEYTKRGRQERLNLQWIYCPLDRKILDKGVKERGSINERRE